MKSDNVITCGERLCGSKVSGRGDKIKAKRTEITRSKNKHTEGSMK